jgi:hypothetical protein
MAHHEVSYDYDVNEDGDSIGCWECSCGAGSGWRLIAESSPAVVGVQHALDAAHRESKIVASNEYGTTYNDGGFDPSVHYETGEQPYTDRPPRRGFWGPLLDVLGL